MNLHLISLTSIWGHCIFFIKSQAFKMLFITQHASVSLVRFYSIIHFGPVSNVSAVKIFPQHTVRSPLFFLSCTERVMLCNRRKEKKEWVKAERNQHLYKFVSQSFRGGSSWQFGPQCVLDKGSGAWWEPYAGPLNQWTVKFNGEPPGWPWPYPGEVLCIMIYREGLGVCLLF